MSRQLVLLHIKYTQIYTNNLIITSHLHFGATYLKDRTNTLVSFKGRPIFMICTAGSARVKQNTCVASGHPK
jgi:hypothetical protein